MSARISGRTAGRDNDHDLKESLKTAKSVGNFKKSISELLCKKELQRSSLPSSNLFKFEDVL